MVRILPILFCLLAVGSSGQTSPSLARGQIIESVSTIQDANQSYALYLPAGYTPARTWPIIYAFDPLARGVVPLRLYKDAAEKYGFILAGSNNSRNFSLQESSKSASAIWDDTHLRLALDPQRTYTMGFSGGARMAGMIALRCGPCRIAGVIAQGAGYPLGEKPSQKTSPLYFLAVGEEDFNWAEVMEVRRERESLGLAYRSVVFPGPHQWAPIAVVEDAVAWIQLKSMQSGAMAPNPSFIAAQFGKVHADAEDAVMRRDDLSELSALRSLVSDFDGLKDIAAYRARLEKLQASPALKQARKKEDEAIAAQQALSSDLLTMLGELESASLEDRIRLRQEIIHKMLQLKTNGAHENSSEKKLPLLRAFHSVRASCIEGGQAQFEMKYFDLAEFYFQIVSDVSPDDIWPVLLLAETSAARGNRKQAISRLRQTVKLGLNNREVFESDRNLQSLRATPEFQKFLSELQSLRRP
ncbi:MAG TPA: hypothetical protein VFA68_07090 [Terriglobales bacterium]|nr:hypothetical protein [Terriglobales bacterium]